MDVTGVIAGSSLLILFILLVRKIFSGKVSYCFIYALWGLVLLRLLCPIGVGSSPVSVVHIIQYCQTAFAGRADEIEPQVQDKKPSVEGRETETDLYHGAQSVQAGISQEKKVGTKKEEVKAQEGKSEEEPKQISDIGKESVATPVEKKADTSKTKTLSSSAVFFIIWVTGCLVVGLMLFCSNLIFSRRLFRQRKYLGEYDFDEGMQERREKGIFARRGLPVYESERIGTPCLYGLLHPAVYLPEGMAGRLSREEVEIVILHESVHYRHGDLLWSAFRSLALALYWYHPMVWVAAVVSRKDAEFACDETVMHRLGQNSNVLYGKLLVQVAGESRGYCPAISMSRNGKRLRDRIYAIAKQQRHSGAVRGTLCAVMLLLAVVAFAGWNNDNSDAAAMPSGKNDNSDTAAMSSGKNGGTVIKQVLTMEQLREWCASGDIQAISYEQWKNYAGAEVEKLDGGERIKLPLSYQGQAYFLFIYGSDSGEIEDIYIQTGEEDRILYTSDERFQPYVVDIEEFLSHEYLLQWYLSYNMPDGLYTGPCYYGLTAESSVGQLWIEGIKEDEGFYGRLSTMNWSADGGVSRVYSDRLQETEEGVLRYDWSTYTGNGRRSVDNAVVNFENGELQEMANTGTAARASVEGVTINAVAGNRMPVWYLPPRDGEESVFTEVKGVSVDALLPQKLWVACVKEKDDAEFTYVFFLNAEKYSREDAEAVVRSVHFKTEEELSRQQEIKKKLTQEQVKEIVPAQAWTELEEYGVFRALGDTFSWGNKKNGETLRLDFTYEGEDLMQYTSKEYGFVDGLPEEIISVEEGKELVRKFAEAMLGEQFEKGEIKEVKTRAAYASEYYAEYEDVHGNVYLVQLNHNMVVKFESEITHRRLWGR